MFKIQKLIKSHKYSRVSSRRGGRLANFGQNNKRGGYNKRGDWQKSQKLINGEAGKNKAVRNFIEIKSSNYLVKISTKRT